MMSFWESESIWSCSRYLARATTGTMLSRSLKWKAPYTEALAHRGGRITFSGSRVILSTLATLMP